jgi:CRP/FNR family transcriptional regulator
MFLTDSLLSVSALSAYFRSNCQNVRMKKFKQGCDLGTCLLCRLCQKEWLQAVDLHRSNFSVAKGEAIFREGDDVKGIFFVYEGTVKVHKHWGEDKELILRFAKKGAIIGHRGLGTELVYPVSGTAVELTTVCFLSLDFFEASLKINHSFLYQLMHFFATELRESERNMRNLAHMPVKGRVAQALLTLQEKFGKSEEGFINLTISRQDLASFAGTTYETTFRILNDFLEEGSIRTEGKEIAIVSSQLLERHLAAAGQGPAS